MAKLSSVNREAKRVATVKKFAAKRAELKALIGDQTSSMEDRMDAMKQLQALPRETLPSRFGPELGRRLDQALGHVPELVRTTSEPVPIEAEQKRRMPEPQDPIVLRR